MALASKLTVGEVGVEACTPLFDEPQYAEKRQGLLDMLHAAPAMLDPVQQHLPETLETALERAVLAWDDHHSDTAGAHPA